MSAPAGIEKEIYDSLTKEAGSVRVRVRLDVPIADKNFVDEFSDSSLDTNLWSWIKPPNTAISEAGTKLTLSSTGTANGFPVVWSLPGKTFPLDSTIGWTLEFTLNFPVITGFGVFFRVCDIQNDEAILAIKNNEADGYTVEMPDGTEIEDLGLAHTASHDYELIYTPPVGSTAGQYELKLDTVSKGTIASTGRQAWYIVIGNGAVQSNVGDWTNIAVDRVDVNLVSNESQDFPDWTDKEQVGSEAGTGWWGSLPWVRGFSLSTHKRNAVDQMILSVPQGGFITGIEGDGANGEGYRSNLFAGFRWANREIRVETQQSDGHRYTEWKEIFRGLCDEPRITTLGNERILEITSRDKVRRLLQMAHVVRGYSDAGTGIDGVVMNNSWTDIIEDLCSFVGLPATDYDILAGTIRPRTWQLMGESALDGILQLADNGVLALYRNAGQTNPGRLEGKNWNFGSDTPAFFISPNEGAVGLDWAETVFGMTAQAVITVQHSEFGEFSDVYPKAPIPPFGAVLRSNAAIAQSAPDINSTRLLPYLRWRMLNRELNSVVASMVGQDWIEHDIECQVLDRDVLKIQDDFYILDGWDYVWSQTEGLRVSLHLVNQHPEKAIMNAALDMTVQQSYA